MSAWLAVAVAVIVGSSVKAITGMGLPPVALPVLAAFVGVEDAIVIMAIPTVMTNFTLIVGNWEHRRETPLLGRMIVVSIVGGVLGAWLLTELDERAIAVAMALLVGAYVVSRLRRQREVVPGPLLHRAAVPVSLVGGVSQGATGLSGTLFGSYLHAMALPQAAFVFAIAALFQSSSAAQVTGLAVLGRYDARLLGLSLLATALAVVVIVGVRRFAPPMPQRTFDALVLGVLVVSAAKMLYDSFQ